MSKKLLFPLFLFLQGCGDSNMQVAAVDPKPEAQAAASKPVDRIPQDPARRAQTAQERILQIGPDLRGEVASAAACELASTGVPVTAAKLIQLEGRVRANGMKAPECRARSFHTGSNAATPA